MKQRSFLLTVGIITLVLFFQYCSKDSGDAVSIETPSLPSTHYNYNEPFPAYMSLALAQLDNTPVDNPITNATEELGK